MAIHSNIFNKCSASVNIIKQIRPGWCRRLSRPYSLDNPHKLLRGDEFHFKIVKCLRPGASADVYVVKDINNGSLATVSSTLADKYVVKRYKSYVPLGVVEREYNILRHLNQIKTLQQCIPVDPALIQTHNDRYLIYPYIEGSDASEYQKKILITQSLECLKQYMYNIVRLAVACQTKANVSHLDIKPNNMIYCPAKQKLSLIDFGSARYLCETDGRKLIPIGHPIGTKYYVAPEILNLNFNNRSDTYCIGRILQYFTDGGMSIGSDGNRLLARMLAVDPMIRPSLTEVMHSPWFSVGGTFPPASNAAPLVPSPRLIAV